MPAISTKTLNTVVYYPSGKAANGNFVWVDRTSSYPNGQSQLSQTPFSSPKAATGVRRVGWKINLPHVGTEATLCACPGQLVDDSSFTLYFDRDPRAASTSNEELRKRLKSLIDDPGFIAAVVDGEPFWA